MDEYEFLETEGGMERGRSREVTPLRKQPGQQQQSRSSPQQESPLRRALEQPPLKRFKVSHNPHTLLLLSSVLEFHFTSPLNIL